MTYSTTRAWVHNAEVVSRVLGLWCKSSDPVPKPADSEIVVYYGGWDLGTLRNTAAGREIMSQDQNWYDDEGWKAETGYYRFFPPLGSNYVPLGSNFKTRKEQLDTFRTMDAFWKPAPVVVAATALLVHFMETSRNLLFDDWWRCSEQFPDGTGPALHVFSGRVRIEPVSNGIRSFNLYLAAAQKC